MRTDRRLSPRDLLPKVARLFELSAGKIRSIEDAWRPEDGAPVFTVQGRRGSSSAQRCCSSTRPATPRSSSWGAHEQSSAWRRT
jgi:hypothetical protein